MNRNGFNFQFSTVILKSDEEVVLAAVNLNGISLDFASDDIRAHREAVLAAVRTSPESLKDSLLASCVRTKSACELPASGTRRWLCTHVQ